ncbi:Protein sevenless [Clonorchis sinensis]|uniref:receptor protein-tyrosine kinase n=2 Tax=Clonorchis sinensis TaxID=79923 RepID=H2KRC6_CLOSI|nr:Protein sevenless [Clonorchis sinensis]GAA35242.2 proto-oncogene tyrosine-protein kinase ROS [Clonorchis sinensis]
MELRMQVAVSDKLIKLIDREAAQFTTMSEYEWGHTLVQFRNHTLENLRPHTFYEFGMNLMFNNGTVKRYPDKASGITCGCKTHADVPSMPLNLQYHYLQDNDYSLEWTPGPDNGEPIITYILKINEIQGKEGVPGWEDLVPHTMTSQWMNFTVDRSEPSQLQLRAVSKIGASPPAYLTIQPPLNKGSGTGGYYPTIFGPLTHATGLVTYTLLSVGLFLLLMLMLIVFVYRRRRADGKAGKHPFLISFNPSRRMNSGSGNDSFGLGGGSDLTTSGIPLDLSTLEPMWNQEVNSLYGIGKSDLLSFEQVTQISAAHIRFERYIGCGAFGKVWEGWLHVNASDGDRFEKVALKVRNSKSLSEAEFKREATLMHRYQHANIVRFFGVSFDSPGQQCLVLEMMDQGNLRDYLHRARPRIAPHVAANMFAAAAICAAGSNATDLPTAAGSEGSSMNTSTTSTAAAGGGNGGGGAFSTNSNVITLIAQLDLAALVSIMRDIAQGCRYLEEQHFVHRDIAARNCLVSHNHPSGRIVKLCDFGLARDIYKNDCYRKRNEPKLPVRWMSPEAIRDGLFTTKSDVWAFAVTCWEVMTLGADPFYGRANVDVMNLVIGGHVLGRPENCPEELYNQMLQCWSRFTEMRPSFADLAKKMIEFVKLSQESDSSFSGPFIVSLPLPRSLPDSSGHPMFACAPTEPSQRRTSTESEHHNLANQRCNRRASFNDCQSRCSQHPTKMQQSMILDRDHQIQINSRTLPLGHDSSRSHMIGQPLLSLRTNTMSITTNRNHCDSRGTNHHNYPTTSMNGFELGLSDPSTEQTTLVTHLMTNTSAEGHANDSQNGQASLTEPLTVSSCLDTGRSPLQKLASPTHGPGPVGRPISLMESATIPMPPAYHQGRDGKPRCYRTLSQRTSTTVQRPHITAPHSLMGTLENPIHAGTDATTHNSQSTGGRSGMSYWFEGLTGGGFGGVDALGYERPSWPIQLPSNPQFHSFQRATMINPNGHTLDNKHRVDFKPKVPSGALSG